MKKYKKGNINLETGMIFWSYSHRVNGKEGWLTKEAFERKVLKQKEIQKSEKSKEYFKNYYQENKQFYKGKNKGYRDKQQEEAPLKLLLSNIRGRARKRKQEFDLDYKFLIDLWNKQAGKCYYTNLPMQCTYAKKSPYQVSIDRKDTFKGYTKDNSILCCLSINFAKNCFTERELKEFLEAFKLI